VLQPRGEGRIAQPIELLLIQREIRLAKDPDPALVGAAVVEMITASVPDTARVGIRCIQVVPLFG
jgi:hypothetical protein